jgi:hypothetical protein
VIVPAQRRPRRGIVFHRAELPEDERTVLDGIPVTTVPRTILDLATILQAAGWRCVPVTYLQLEHTSAEVGRDLRRLLIGLPSLP